MNFYKNTVDQFAVYNQAYTRTFLSSTVVFISNLYLSIHRVDYHYLFLWLTMEKCSTGKIENKKRWMLKRGGEGGGKKKRKKNRKEFLEFPSSPTKP